MGPLEVCYYAIYLHLTRAHLETAGRQEKTVLNKNINKNIFRLKSCEKISTSSLSQNLDVLIKKKTCSL